MICGNVSCDPRAFSLHKSFFACIFQHAQVVQLPAEARIWKAFEPVPLCYTAITEVLTKSEHPQIAVQV